jgi:hypothetical protein
MVIVTLGSESAMFAARAMYEPVRSVWPDFETRIRASARLFVIAGARRRNSEMGAVPAEP